MKKILNIPEKQLPIKPLTRDELEEDIKKRLSIITEEFTKGLQILKKHASSVTFFGSSFVKEGDGYYEKAKGLASRVVKELNYSIVTGGGPGIMEAANRGAYEAGGVSVGLNIKLLEDQRTNPYVAEEADFYYFFIRKVCLSFSAETYIFFPGGFGTMDEMFEILTLVQTKKIKPVPIVLFGKTYWSKWETLFREELLKRGMIDEEDMSLYTITDSEDEVISLIKSTPVQSGVPYNTNYKN